MGRTQDIQASTIYTYLNRISDSLLHKTDSHEQLTYVYNCGTISVRFSGGDPMIHTLDDYICHSIDPSDPFTTNPSLTKKVDHNGAFLPFVGNTVVYDLDDRVKAQLTALQDELYAVASDVLSCRLDPSTFHMTLHDLVNGSAGEYGIRERMESITPVVRQILREWNNHAPIHMKSTWMFNMVNTSIVLGLKPADADSYSRLDAMYCKLDEVLTLGYPLCPHITLAYFRPGQYSPSQIEGLCGSLRAVELDIELKAENLKLQNFDHMNHYYSI